MVCVRCEADEACQNAYPIIREEFAWLMERLRQEPVTHKFTNPADGQPGSVVYTAGLLAEIVRVMTLDVKFTARLPWLIHKVYAENDWMGITDLFLQYGTMDWGSQMMGRVIRCHRSVKGLGIIITSRN